jgi:hypothetical protein
MQQGAQHFLAPASPTPPPKESRGTARRSEHLFRDRCRPGILLYETAPKHRVLHAERGDEGLVLLDQQLRNGGFTVKAAEQYSALPRPRRRYAVQYTTAWNTLVSLCRDSGRGLAVARCVTGRSSPRREGIALPVGTVAERPDPVQGHRARSRWRSLPNFQDSAQ